MSRSQVGNAQARAIAAGKLVETVNSLDRVEFLTKYLHSEQMDEAQKRIKEVAASDLHLDLLFPAFLRTNKIVLESCLKLIEESSASDYRASEIKWSAASKRKEMLLPDMRYLVITSSGTDVTTTFKDVLGFISFMTTYEDGHEVIYVYEIHLARQLRGLGVGVVLMEEVESIGRCIGVEKCMLTVFGSNERAVRWYDRLGYVIDEFSPRPRVLRNGTVKQPSYKILSKALMAGEA